MENDLFGQLDLAIYTQQYRAWWQQPVMLALCVVLLVGVVVGLIVVMRKKRKKESSTYVQQLINLFYERVHAWQAGASTGADLLVLLTALVKQYTRWCVKNDAIIGMTDQEWLVFVQEHSFFKSVHEQSIELVRRLTACKFHTGEQSDGCVLIVCDLVYQIIAKTSDGAIAPESGLNINNQKTAAT